MAHARGQRIGFSHCGRAKREVDEAEFRADPDAMLDRLQSGCEAVVINAGGKIVAALLNPPTLEQLRRTHDRFDELRAKIAEDFRGIPMDPGMAGIDAAVHASEGSSFQRPRHSEC